MLFWPHLFRFELKQYWALSIELQEQHNARIYEHRQLDSEILNTNYGAVLT